MQIQPYLFFNGRAEEALNFYRQAIGAETTVLMRYKDNPEPAQASKAPPGSENKIMHASVRIGETTIMASDGRCLGEPKFEGFALSLTAASEAEAKRIFAALAEGGNVVMPLARIFFSPSFGMVTDRFGVSWMVIVPQQS